MKPPHENFLRTPLVALLPACIDIVHLFFHGKFLEKNQLITVFQFQQTCGYFSQIARSNV